MALFAPQLASAQTSTDTTVADFNLGTTGANTYISNMAGGEVILAPEVGEEFDALPASWESCNWASDDTGATCPAGTGTSVSTGSLVVDGDRFGPDPDEGPYAFGAGRSLEFFATFGSDPFNHVGFGEKYAAQPWAMFSVRGDGNLAARTDAESGAPAETQTVLDSALIGTPHLYRIEWSATGVRYLVDTVEVANHPVAITQNLRPLVSDFTGAGTSVVLDWLHMSDYPATGTFNSAVIDSGEQSDWGTLSSLVTIPAGTGVAFSVRTGDTPTPDGTWSDPIPVVNGNDIPASSRYLQYSAELSSTTDNDTTPVVNDVTVAFAPTPPEPPADTPAQPAQPAAPVVAGGTASSAAKKNCKKIKSKKKRKKCKRKQRD